ncbi:MAG: hypothetical protein J7647_30965 [Cyanobacteria bacterium SBLK]|nr:hypothetical protein [Cyanobacteria bacterium SBLK]
MSTLTALLERPDLKEKHRGKLEKMQGVTLSPAAQFAITRIAKQYSDNPKNEDISREKRRCSAFHRISLSDLLEFANNEEQQIIHAIFNKDKQQRQEDADKISLSQMNFYRLIDVQDGEKIYSIISKYYEEEMKEELSTIEGWREFVAEIIEMQLFYFSQITELDKPDRLNKFEQLLWDYNFAMREDDEEEKERNEEEEPLPTINNQIDKRNAKIDWSKS